MIDDSDDNDNSKAGLSITSFAILIAVIALTLAWVAYNRTGQDLEESVSDTYNITSERVGENSQ